MTSHKEIVLDGELSLNIPMDGEVGAVTKVVEHDLPVYTGATTVEPDFDGTVLMTAQKVVNQNITVNPIQVESVSNPTGGRTVYIGGII